MVEWRNGFLQIYVVIVAAVAAAGVAAVAAAPTSVQRKRHRTNDARCRDGDRRQWQWTVVTVLQAAAPGQSRVFGTAFGQR